MVDAGASLSQLENKEDFENTVMAIVIVANSESAEEGSECQKRIEDLEKTIKSFENKMREFESAIDSINTSNYEINVDESSHNALHAYINDIFAKAIKLSYHEESKELYANFYHNPAFIEHFKQLCYTFLSWTNVMRPFYPSSNAVGTSARSETYFGKIKQEIPRPITMIKFLLKDLRKIIGLTNFTFMHLPQTEIEVKNDDGYALKIKLDDIFVNSEMVKLIEKISKLNVGDVNVTTEISMNDSVCSIGNSLSDVGSKLAVSAVTSSPLKCTEDSHNEERRLLPNGNTLGFKEYLFDERVEPIHIQKQLRFINTCSYDSIFEVVVSICFENNTFKNEVRSHNNIIFLKNVLNYCDDYKLDDAVNSRAQLLYSICKNNLAPKNSLIINCRQNVIEAFRNLMKSFYSYTISKSCACGMSTVINDNTISINNEDFFVIGIENLESILEKKTTEKLGYCHQCLLRDFYVSYSFHNYIAVDLERFHEKKNQALFKNYLSTRDAFSFKTNFNKIPEYFELVGQRYE